MDLREYLAVFRKNALLGLIVFTVAFALMVFFVASRPPQYTASARVLFTLESSATGEIDVADLSAYLEQQVDVFAEIATSPGVLQPVLDQVEPEATLDDFSDKIDTRASVSGSVLVISASDISPARATAMANGVAEQLAAVASGVPSLAGEAFQLNAEILAPAVVPAANGAKVGSRDLAFAAILAILAGAGATVVKELLDGRVLARRDIESIADVPVVGDFARVGNIPISSANGREDASLQIAAKQMRENFLHRFEERKSVMVTSSVPSEGAGDVVAQLAETLADSGLRLLVVDARRPTQGSGERAGSAGLADVLEGNVSLGSAVSPGEVSGISLLVRVTDGQLASEPSWRRMPELLAHAEFDYDFVLVVADPLATSVDAVALGRITAGTILVVGSGIARLRDVRGAMATLADAGISIQGIVLNKYNTGLVKNLQPAR
ncbi:polysaccharide biosynthesis tyrosine autokinase [Georgenia thermotolerans]|uniref:Polysaccharide chain length determinant N-terminal domain-containing protein n=1 Tax=Georgenia thermotolerans TaxID=527326 RepID=A0A7J5USV1_9MICO|nr:polysaccharide biosynthesis tyrosine autokinase [Georgenia thermotolerans]KAE8765244.1 hypothetical protein GB883_04750 [Georgenia thermotolerans]